MRSSVCEFCEQEPARCKQPFPTMCVTCFEQFSKVTKRACASCDMPFTCLNLGKCGRQNGVKDRDLFEESD